jgi:two-component system chemotaxis response regulator CheY
MAKLLVVDDSPAMRKFLTGLLADDHELIVGEDGIDAVWHFKTEKPDAVLLDINMPLMTGLEALLKIRVIDPDARVAMLTGERDESSIVKAISAGAADFVAKPYTRERVTAAVEALLAA